MVDEDKSGYETVVKYFKKYVEPFLAIFIFVLLLSVAYAYFQDSSLKKEISENCGWQHEEYECYCQKDDVQEIKNTMNGKLIVPGFNSTNYEVVPS